MISVSELNQDALPLCENPNHFNDRTKKKHGSTIFDFLKLRTVL